MIEQAVEQLRRQYRRHRSRHERRYAAEAAAGSPLQLEELDKTLEILGIGHRERIFVHSHSAVLGQLPGGVRAVVDTLKRRVGEQGLIMMPTYPHRGSFWDYAHGDPLFDVRRTPSQMGLMTEFFRRDKQARRSVHPTHPVSLWGEQADEWAVGHDQAANPFHARSPFGRLHRAGGKVLFMELDGWHLTQIHVAEALLGSAFPDSPYIDGVFHMRVADENKQHRRVAVQLAHPWFSSRIDARHFYGVLEQQGIVRRHKLRGYIPFVAVDARPMVEFFVDLATRGRSHYRRSSAMGYARGLLARLTLAPPKSGRPL